jgi:hypothetical protein
MRGEKLAGFGVGITASARSADLAGLPHTRIIAPSAGRIDNQPPRYAGCEVVEVGGRLTLATAPAEAANIIGRNVAAMIEETPAEDRREVILTGPMAVWAYLIVFHQVIHKFGRVVYSDGRGNDVLVAQH